MKGCYHALVQLPGHREGIMVDTGALDNLMSDSFYDRVKKCAEPYGLGSTMRFMKQALGIEGVGKQGQTCTREGILPISLEDGTKGMFTAPVIERSEIPALLGLRTMQNQKAIIDTFGMKYIIPGPGGIEMKLSPGTKVYN